MKIHYNAFISYRHHPDDIRVAQQIHRALERFHIPAAIRKKRQEKGNLRLFRDKEELPITSNLNDDIDEALCNSDYLIVICSVHTKESIWVQREIELFLKTHHRNRVLTVLASGEPYDVIPEILLKEDVVDPVTGETRQVLVEPLSCDWRIGRKKAIREELPRLAAPLLGCAYDELRQRQKQYRTRRIIAFLTASMVASLALAAYFLQTSITIHRANLQVQANLEQSQRNQSRHLATAAREKLTEGDRLTAIALAAAALPSEDHVRPYVAEAEFVLADALGVYQPTAQIKAVGAISPGGQAAIRDFWVSSTDHALYIYDSRDALTVWDTETMQKRATLEFQGCFVDDVYILPQGNALIKAGYLLYCYTPDGVCLWQKDVIWKAALLDDTTVLAISTDAMQQHVLCFFDARTGEQTREPLNLDVLGSEFTSVQLCQTSYTQDMPLLIRYSDTEKAVYCLFDLQSGSYKTVSIPEQYLTFALSHAGKLFIMGAKEGDSMMGSFEGNRVNAPVSSRIYCYDMQTTELLWESSISTDTFSAHNMLAPIPGKNQLLCQTGSVFQVLDMETGETLGRCEAGGSVLCVTMDEMFASCILEDGYRCNYWYEENYCYEFKCMESGLTKAEIADGFYGLKFGGTTVTVYRQQAAEAAWSAPVEGSASVSNSLVGGDLIAVENYSQIFLFDAATHSIRWQIPADGRSLLAFSQDGTKLWCTKGNKQVYEIDTATGEDTLLDLDAELEANRSYVYGDLYMADDLLFYTQYNSENGTYLSCHNLLSGQETLFPLTEFMKDGDNLRCRLIQKYGQYAYFWTTAETVLELDLTNGTLQQILEGITQRPNSAVSADGTVAVTDLNRVHLLAPDADIPATIELGEAKAGSLCFYGDQLLALCDDGYIHRFDSAGLLQSKTQLQLPYSFADKLLDPSAIRDSVIWQFTQDGKLILNTFRVGNVIDCESWKPVSYITSLLSFRESENRFICCPASAIVGYNRYDVDALLALAKDALNGFSLTQEEKAAYGIN